MSTIQVTIVQHTHWDREWYFPFQVFRYHLVKLVDGVLDLLAIDPDYGPYTLDGQAILLEDYLALRPHREGELRKYVQAGRLLIGPWYVLPDEFLVSGESLARNLMLGSKICQRFGGQMNVGYTPDSFGHIGQLPQILAQCGMEAAVFRRGLSDEPAELWWQAPDGTRLFAIYLRDGYDHAAHLPGDPDGFTRTVRSLVNRLAPYCATSYILLMNGGDHASPLPNLPALIRSANEESEGIQLRQGSLPQFIVALRKEMEGSRLRVGDPASQADGLPPATFQLSTLPIVQGELRSPKRHHLLSGVLSSRMWIKQQNDACQIELTSYAEPLAAIGWLLGGRDLRQELWQAWRYLIENHPHDSICGCSVDQVHEEMRTRFAWSAQIAEAVATEALTTLGCHVSLPEGPKPEAEPPSILALHSNGSGRVVSVYNPSNGPRTDRVAVQIPELPPDWNYRLLDEEGSPVSLEPDDEWKAHLLANWRPDSMALMGLLEQIKNGGLLSRPLLDARLQMIVKKEETLHAQQAPRVVAELDLVLAELVEPGKTNKDAIFQFVDRVHCLLDEGRISDWRVRVWLSRQVQASFMARDVPGYGYKAYRLESVEGSESQGKSSPLQKDTLQSVNVVLSYAEPTSLVFATSFNTATGNAIENEFFQVVADPQDGTFTLLDKRSELRLAGLNRLVDSGDRGDEYNFCPPANDLVVDTPATLPRIAIYAEGSTGWRLEVARRYRIPIRLARDRSRRSSRFVSVPVVSRIWLRPGVLRVDIETTVDNRAEDHRLRVLFPTPFHADRSLAEGQFDLVPRSLTLPTNTAGYLEQPAPTAPHGAFVAVQDGERGLILANRGLPEYEAIPCKRGVTLALTLLRSVGWLSRDDLDCRPGLAGPSLPTPGAQCLGLHTFAYSLIPFSGNSSEAIQRAYAFRVPLRASVAWTGNAYLPASLSFARLEPAELVISTVKPADDGDGWIVRFWNTSDRSTTARLTLGFDLAEAELINLLEKCLTRLSVDDRRTLELPVRGKQIVSVKLRPVGWK